MNHEKELKKQLASLLLIFIEGRNYDTCNPYGRNEVKEGLKLLQTIELNGEEPVGPRDWMDVDLKKIIEG